MVASTLAALDAHLANKASILITAQPGTGTVTALEAKCAELGLSVQYYSSPIMDVFDLVCDFYGAMPPDGKGGLELVHTDTWQDPDVVIFDNLDRATPELQHAVEELVKYNLVNGKYLPTRRTIIVRTASPEFASAYAGAFGVIV